MNIYKRKQIASSGHLTSPFYENLELMNFYKCSIENFCDYFVSEFRSK